MVRFLFFIALLVFISCSKIDDLPIDKIEENPVFSINLNVGGIPFSYEAGIDDYFMFAGSDTIGALRINRGLLAPSFDRNPILESALSINFVGQDIRSGIFIRPDTGDLALFNNDTIPYWEMNIQASLFGDFDDSPMKVEIDGEEFNYSSQKKYMVQRRDKNKVKLKKTLGDKNYYYALTSLEGNPDNLGSQYLHIFLEGDNEENAKIYVQSNLNDFSLAIIFPDGSMYDFKESILVNQLGEYKISAVSNTTSTLIETNFFIERDERNKLKSSRINFTGNTSYIGMIESLNSAFIEYYDAEGKFYTSVPKGGTVQPASSFLRIEKVEVFQPNISDEPADKITFSGEIILISSDNKTLLFTGSGTIALGR